MTLLGAKRPQPPAGPEPDGYVIGIRDGERLHLTDASVRKTKGSAEEELRQWRSGRDRRRFVLCAVTIVEER